MPSLPIVGKVPKGWLIAVGIGSVGMIFYVMHRRNAAAAAPAADTADTSGDLSGDATDPNAIDPATGLTYAEESAQGAYGTAGGYIDPATGQYIDPGTVTAAGVTPGAPATNAEWAQQAEAELSGVADPTALAAALGKYLTAQAVTADQQSLIDQAIAFDGYPPASGPGGYPPAIKTTAGTGTTGTGGTGGTGKSVRHVATGTESLNAVAKSRRTTAAHIESVTEAAPENTKNLSRFRSYVARGTGKRMPAGLVYYTSN